MCVNKTPHSQSCEAQILLKYKHVVCGPVCIAVVDAMPGLMAQFKVSSTSDLWLGFNQPAENAIRQGSCSVQMNHPDATWGCTQLIIWVGHLLVSCTGRYRAGERSQSCGE